MKIVDLVTRLDTLWPFGGEEQINSAIADYRSVLGPFEGSRLEAAWIETLSKWTGFRPLPADIRARLPVEKQNATTGEAHVDMKEQISLAKHQTKRLEDAWWRDNANIVDSFLDSFDEDDRLHARGHLRRIIEERAWIAGQHQALGRSAYVQLNTNDLETIRGRVASQRRHAEQVKAATHSIGEGLKPLHVPMREQVAKEEQESLPYKIVDEDREDDPRI